MTGCHPGRLPVELTGVPGSSALNARLEFSLAAPVDPLSVTSRAVVVRDGAGVVLPCALGTVDGRLTIALVLDAARVSAPPGSVFVTLAGAPSAHALAVVDGRSLAGTRIVEVLLEPRLEGARARLIEIGGQHPETLARDVPLPPPWRLVYDQPLDPLTLGNAPGPVRRREAGVALGEVAAHVALRRIVGPRCEVEVLLDDPGRLGGAVLDLERWGVRDLTGARPEPPLVVPLAVTR